MATSSIRPGEHADVLHGVTVPDPYRVLEDPASAVTRQWSAEQQKQFAEARASWPARGWFADRLAGLARTGGVGTPVFRGDRWFATRREPDQEHAVLVTGLRTDPAVAGTTLVDPMALDSSGATTLDSWEPSWEGTRVAVQVSAGGTEESAVTVLDSSTGEIVDGPIDRSRYSPIAWLRGGSAYYYVRRLAPHLVPHGESQLHRRVYLHRVGTDPDGDIEIFGADSDKTCYFDVTLSRDGRWLVIAATAGTAPRSDIWLADLDDAAAGSGPDTPRLHPVHVGVDARSQLHIGNDGLLYVQTDLGAPRGRLCVADPRTPEPEHWLDLVAEDPEAVLQDWAILDGTDLDRPVLLSSHSRHAVAEMTVHDPGTGTRLAEVTLPGPGSVGGFSVRPEGGSSAWFAYTDHLTPTEVLRLDLAGRVPPEGVPGSASLVPVVALTPPGNPDVGRVRAQLHTYASADGTTVRLFVLSPGGSADHPRPTVLYGYGGFGISMAPTFTAAALAWVAAGGVWAVACLRGGGEEGESWHRAGMREHKQNVFDDFAAAAQWLISAGWTTSDQLAISGGSNGGLLVGATMTRRPELFAAVACSAPLLDMIRYERFGLGETWNDEYGKVADPVEFGWLHAYSPYHRVTPGTAYPAVLFTIFDGDTRVDPLHARKLAALLQASTAAPPDERPILVRAEAEVGHGSRSVTRAVELGADTLGFLARHTGLLPEQA